MREYVVTLELEVIAEDGDDAREELKDQLRKLCETDLEGDEFTRLGIDLSIDDITSDDDDDEDEDDLDDEEQNEEEDVNDEDDDDASDVEF
jgi:hypothetical protein